MQRRNINRLSCMKCITNGRRNEQAVAAQCETCQETFAAYFCAICRLFDDDASHDIHHCDACGICRRGTAETLHHCNICGTCYPNAHTNSRRCIPNILQRNPCPVCLGECQESTLQVIKLACHHVIHVTCLDNYLLNEYTNHYVFGIPRCPLCLKSIFIDVANDRVRERFIRHTPMPSEIAIKRIEIICNDCLTHFVASKNIIGYQCINAQCRSFNCGEKCDLPDDTPITPYQPEEGDRDRDRDHDDEDDDVDNIIDAVSHTSMTIITVMTRKTKMMMMLMIVMTTKSTVITMMQVIITMATMLMIVRIMLRIHRKGLRTRTIHIAIAVAIPHQ